jgi:osmotically-inducible protein OsmY
MTTTHRLDSDIFAAARKALDDDPLISQDVRVHVDGGAVTLTGTVRGPHDKSRAEAVVRQASGVHPIINHIVVAEVVTPDSFGSPEFS